MKRIMLSVALGFLCAATGAAQPASGTEAHYTRSQIRAMIAHAKTPAEYEALSDYFRQAADVSRRKAIEEKQEWDLRKTYPPGKYPRPVDSAHYLYDYYLQDANAKTAKANYYQKLAQRLAKPD